MTLSVLGYVRWDVLLRRTGRFTLVTGRFPPLRGEYEGGESVGSIKGSRSPGMTGRARRFIGVRLASRFLESSRPQGLLHRAGPEKSLIQI